MTAKANPGTNANPLPRASATSMARTTVINPLGKTQKINSWLWTAIPRHAQRLERMASQRARNNDPSVPAMSKGCSRKIPSCGDCANHHEEECPYQKCKFGVEGEQSLLRLRHLRDWQ